MDEHAQTVGNFLDDRHAESRRRIAALEAELAERTRERDEARMHFTMVASHFPDGDLTIGAVRRQAEEWLREHDAALLAARKD